MNRRAIRAVLAGTALACGVGLPAGSVGASSPAPRSTLTCRAYASNDLPAPKTKVLIYVHTKPKVPTHAWAAFQTRTEERSAVANTYGNATLTYAIGTAKKGFRVGVKVLVSDTGGHAYCYTHFTPR